MGRPAWPPGRTPRLALRPCLIPHIRRQFERPHASKPVNMRSSDEILIARTLAGGRASFAELTRRHEETVRTIAVRFLGNREDAEDAIQDTFETAYRRLPELRDHTVFGAWLRRVAENTCRMALRRSRDAQPVEDALLDDTETAPARMERLERDGLIEEALNRLPAKNRQALVLHYSHGMAYEQIAGLLGAPVSTVEGRLYRGRRQLRDRLAVVENGTRKGQPMDEERVKEVLREAHLSTCYAAHDDRVRREKDHPPNARRSVVCRVIMLFERNGAVQNEITGIPNYGSIMFWDGVPHPPVETSMPFRSFATLGPFDGTDLLQQEVGTCGGGRDNYGLPPTGDGQDALLRLSMTTQLLSKSETVSVPFGTFNHCALIETTVTERPADKPVSETVRQALAYAEGTKHGWVAPGVGVVRLEYRHSNGTTTVAELTDAVNSAQTDAYLPVALENKWAYDWTDPSSGAAFHDWLRVLERRSLGDDVYVWLVSYVTCAEAPDGAEAPAVGG